MKIFFKIVGFCTFVFFSVISARTIDVYGQTVTPSITIVSPKGGETIQVGTATKILWKSVGNVGSTVDIFYSECSSCIDVIESNVPNTGEYTWNVKSRNGQVKTEKGMPITIEINGSNAARAVSKEVYIVDKRPPVGFSLVSSDISRLSETDSDLIRARFTIDVSNNDDFFSAGILPKAFTIKRYVNELVTKDQEGGVIVYRDASGTQQPESYFSIAGDKTLRIIIDYTFSTKEITQAGSYKVVLEKVNWSTPVSPYTDTTLKFETPRISLAPSSFIKVVTPNGGESYDLGGVIPISWKSENIIGGVSVDVMTPDASRMLASQSFKENTGSHKFIISKATPPGKYVVRVRARGAEDSSDNSFYIGSINMGTTTLNSPVLPTPNVKVRGQSVTPSQTSVKSGGSVTLTYVTPTDTVRTTLYLSCGTGITSSFGSLGVDYCNKWYPIPLSELTSKFILKNTSGVAREVVPNFYVYTKDRPNYGVGVATRIVVTPDNTPAAKTGIKKASVTKDKESDDTPNPPRTPTLTPYATASLRLPPPPPPKPPITDVKLRPPQPPTPPTNTPYASATLRPKLPEPAPIVAPAPPPPQQSVSPTATPTPSSTIPPRPNPYHCFVKCQFNGCLSGHSQDVYGVGDDGTEEACRANAQARCDTTVANAVAKNCPAPTVAPSPTPTATPTQTTTPTYSPNYSPTASPSSSPRSSIQGGVGFTANIFDSIAELFASLFR